jgi:hypothetical protein
MTVPALLAVLRRPALWYIAGTVGRRMLDPKWWRRVPPLPRPAPAYAAMRHQAMFGSDPEAALGPDELIGYLEWCARMAKVTR